MFISGAQHWADGLSEAVRQEPFQGRHLGGGSAHRLAPGHSPAVPAIIFQRDRYAEVSVSV